MSLVVPEHRVIRFGPFTLDPRTGELSNNGRRCTLQEKPLQLLIALIDEPGELITREELRSRLWGPDVYVDFDLSLNKAVNRLREALGDSAENPQFIETLPRRGYRFLGHVERLPVHRGNGNGSAERTVPKVDSLVPVLLPTEKSLQSPIAYLHGTKLFPLIGCFAVIALTSIFIMGRLWTQSNIELTGITQVTNDGTIERGPLLSNGGLLFYNQRVGETWEIAQVSAASGTSVAVPGSQDFYLGDIAPDGSELLVGPSGGNRASPVYTLALPTGTPHRIGDMHVLDASWSPEGTTLAFSSDEDGFFLANRDGKNARKLFTAPGPVSPIRWSPDGRTLRFTVSDIKADRLSIWEAKANGTGLRQFHPELRPQAGEWGLCCGTWTPDGKYYVFQSDRGGAEALWAVSEERWPLLGDATPTRLTSGPERVVGSAFSRDGKALYVIGLLQHGELVRYDPHDQRFLPYLPGHSAVQLNFSRDGQRLAYVSFPDRALWRCKADGEECARLTYSPMVAAWPQWSPDGKQLVFAGQARGAPFHIFVVSAEGGTPLALTNGERDELPASWSPDGKEIVYGTAVDFEGKTLGINRVNVMTGANSTIPSSSQTLRFPQLSPDGKYIAAIDGDTLVLMDSRTQSWRSVGLHPVTQPSWSPDSKYLFFVFLGEGQPQVCRLRMKDQKVEQMASLAPLKRQSYGGFSWFGLGLDGSLLAFQDTSTSEIYSFSWRVR